MTAEESVAARPAGPVIVAGMHRSGTSLVASIVEVTGVAMGERQVAADRNNRHGYHEDVDFLELQRTMLRAATSPHDGGHPDWGWTEGEGLDREAFAAFREPARQLVERRRQLAGRWGWKDPRTTLLLDFWEEMLAESPPVYVLVYRHPWGVADSMQRIGADVFLRHPDYGWRVWAFYNRHLLDFYSRHRSRSILVSADALQREPAALEALLADRFGLVAAQKGAGPLDTESFRSFPPDDPLIPLAAALHPGCAALLAEMDAVADLSGRETWIRRAPLARPSAGSRVSVVVPCHDDGEFLAEAIASVERSLPEPYELTVVDDGSTDERTREILATLRDAGYRVLTQAAAGLPAARNAGIDASRGPYVLPLDADNRLLAGFAAAAAAVLDERPEIGVVYGERREFGLRQGPVGVPDFDLGALLGANFIDACALMRKEVWAACGGFDPAMSLGWEDWDLWLGACARDWGFQRVPVAALEYRVRPGSMVSAFASPEVRRQVLGFLARKHHALYAAHLPELVAFAQDTSVRLWDMGRRVEVLAARLAAMAESERPAAESAARAVEIERLRGELAAAAAAAERLATEQAASAGEAERLRAAQASASARMEDAQRETVRLSARADALDAELRNWQNRVAEMESTRAWRLRARVLQMRRALERWRARRRLVARRLGSRGSGRGAVGLGPLPNFYHRQLSAQEIGGGVHRDMVGGLWDEVGTLQFRYLLAQGLLPQMRLLDIGCGALRGGVHFVAHLLPGNYFGMDVNSSLLEAGWRELRARGLADRVPAGNLVANERFEAWRFGELFDFVLAQSVFSHLPASWLRRCLQELASCTCAGARFFCTYFECPADVDCSQPHHDPAHGGTTYPDRDPFHYRPEDLAAAASGLPWQFIRLGEWGHPRGQKMALFVRR